MKTVWRMNMWWICPNGHRWQQRIQEETPPCPECEAEARMGFGGDTKALPYRAAMKAIRGSTRRAIER